MVSTVKREIEQGNLHGTFCRSWRDFEELARLHNDFDLVEEGLAVAQQQEQQQQEQQQQEQQQQEQQQQEQQQQEQQQQEQQQQEQQQEQQQDQHELEENFLEDLFHEFEEIDDLNHLAADSEDEMKEIFSMFDDYELH